MGTAANLIANWTGLDPGRVQLYKNSPDLVLRWLNEAQLRFADKSEVLKSVWEPDISSDGIVDLPENFLREIPSLIDGVQTIKWDSTTRLLKGDYSELILDNSLSSPCYYAIHGGKFYVFVPTAGTPTIPYVIKPEEITIQTLKNDDLEIPSQYQLDLLLFLDAMWNRNTNGYQMMEVFESKASSAGLHDRIRKQSYPRMKGGVL